MDGINRPGKRGTGNLKQHQRIVLATHKNTLRVTFQQAHPVEDPPLPETPLPPTVHLHVDPSTLQQWGSAQVKISRTVAFLIGLYAAL
jgi:hypothetical protein